MQELYRIISRDYKSSYSYWTQNKDVFDLFAGSHDGLEPLEVPEAMAIETECEDAWDLLHKFDYEEQVKFPMVLLGETTIYMS